MTFDRPPLLLVELNEMNFRFVEQYIARGELPTFKRLFERHGFRETTSETRYEHLEPWIQWVTAHTGLSFADHQVFRLGDIVDADLPQIWEQLEEAGLRVGALSPMNAKCRLRQPAFFIPDPWTETSVMAPAADRRFFTAIREAVNDNAEGGMGPRAMMDFALGGLRNAAFANYGAYMRLLARARSKTWNKALFLDQVLADMFIRLTRQTRPQFASIFLNAAAHIQHHYMFNSAVYEGESRNPAWYVAPEADPVADVYRLYDRILSQMMVALPTARLMLATGLHQVPYGRTTFYWRLVDHEGFLRRLGVELVSVEPRMSRDMLVRCADAAQAAGAAKVLESARTTDGQALFEIDNRGTDLFVTLVYPDDIPDTIGVTGIAIDLPELRRHVAFVAIKNGEHNGTGYLLDTGSTFQGLGDNSIALERLPDVIRGALGLDEARTAA